MSKEIFAILKGHSGKVEVCMLVGVGGSSLFKKISQEICSNSAELGRLLSQGTNKELPIKE